MLPLLQNSTALFTEHPLSDVRRTMQNRDALCSTRVEKANASEIDEIHFFQIQSDLWPPEFNLRSHLSEAFTSQFPAQSNARVVLTRNPLNLQRHDAYVPCPHLGMQPMGHS